MCEWDEDRIGNSTIVNNDENPKKYTIALKTWSEMYN